MHHYQISLILQSDGRYFAKCKQCGAEALLLFTTTGIISERIPNSKNLDLTRHGSCEDKKTERRANGDHYWILEQENLEDEIGEGKS
jgi:hypothetical protein